MADVLLVNSSVADPLLLYRQKRMAPPLGLAYLCAAMKKEGISVAAIDMNIPFLNFGDLERMIEKECPRIIGISVYTETFANGLKIANTVKGIDSKIITVMGGPHVTFVPNEVLRHSEVDIVVRGEGENTMLELTRHFLDGFGSLNDIRGITYREHSDIITTPDRPFINDLDTLPLPDRSLFPLALYRDPGTISTGRGCPYRCIFCAAGPVSGYKYRMRSPDNIVAEIAQLQKEYGIKFFSFVDDTFTAFPDHTLRILDLLQELDYKVRWQCTTRVNMVTREMLKRMSETGCTAITLGIESGSQKILDSIRKKISVSQSKDTVKWALESGIKPFCSFTIPHPQDTEETVLETRDLMIEFAKEGADVSISFTVPYPGTYLYEHSRELGMIPLFDKWEDFLTTHPNFFTKHLSLGKINSLVADTITALENLRR